MGCDIHIRTEVKQDNGLWVLADLFDKDGDVTEVYTGRNYRLFSILADVRNYNRIKPISNLRGIPEDCSDETLKSYKDWDMDAHSATWYTLRELEDYLKENPKTKYSGMITLEQSASLDMGEFPESWCRYTNAEGYVYREWESEETQLTILIANIKDRADHKWVWDSDRVRIIFWFDN